jgi:hypothetical protein
LPYLSLTDEVEAFDDLERGLPVPHVRVELEVFAAEVQ